MRRTAPTPKCGRRISSRASTRGSSEWVRTACAISRGAKYLSQRCTDDLASCLGLCDSMPGCIGSAHVINMNDESLTWTNPVFCYAFGPKEGPGLHASVRLSDPPQGRNVYRRQDPACGTPNGLPALPSSFTCEPASLFQPPAPSPSWPPPWPMAGRS